MVYRAPSGLLSWLSIQCAVVLVLVIITTYAGMHLQGKHTLSFHRWISQKWVDYCNPSTIAQTKDLVDCQGYDSAARGEVEQQGLTCYTTANKPVSLKAFDHWAVRNATPS
jgi:hypothetical protein